MITPTGADFAWLILVVALLGAGGGIAAELLQNRGNVTGAIQLPTHATGSRLVDLGIVGSMIIGAVAAIAVLYVIPPTTATAAAASNATTTSYDIVKGVALSILAGSAGRGLLTSLQSRLLASAGLQQAQAAVKVGSAQVDGAVKEVQASAQQAFQSEVATRLPELQQALVAAQQAGQPVPTTAPQVTAVVDSIVAGAAQKVGQSARARAETAKDAIASAAPVATELAT
jgi:hypothetical protein